MKTRNAARLAAIWIPVIVAALVSTLCFFTAREIGKDYRFTTGGTQVPFLSRIFYPEAVAIYFFPVILAAWAIYGTQKEISTEHTRLLIITTLSTTLHFIAAWVCGMILPYTHLILRPF